MTDRSNIIKEAIEYRDKLEKKVEELAQAVVRLQISLDFADNTIKNKDREIEELKAYKDVNENFKIAWKELKTENERLIEGLGLANKYVNKYHQTLQDIKEIAERGFFNSQCNCGLKADIEQILQKITKAESEVE